MRWVTLSAALLMACGAPATPVPVPSADNISPEPVADAPVLNTIAALRDPSLMTQPAPAEFTVTLDTTAGEIVIDVVRELAPNAADRFYGLVRIGYYDDVAFFRVVSRFMAQTGIHGDPEVSAIWREATIRDDIVRQSNVPGSVAFAQTSQPDSRTTQFFINLVDNSRLDDMGFAPFGQVRDLASVEQLYAGYGEASPRGQGPPQRRIQEEGNAFLRSNYLQLDYIRTARVTSP